MAATPTREVARRVFAGEFNDATYTFKESDDDRAPVYVLLPTGERANRVFVVGTLTETEDVGEDSEYWQGRIVDPNGDTYFAYAGQYQPDAASMLRELEPPAYVSIVGKPRTYETDDGEVNVSIRPESITPVDETTRNRWVVETAERTLERVQHYGEADPTQDDYAADEYVQMAHDEYEPAVENYRRLVVEALESLEEETAEPEA
ncbi:DNA-binding protein [Halorhabdus sp. BNX81]|uniref:RPA family protein n=1 Tax=Halorhabdus sp. BNX81 TaxID=2980181 RepID=UPI0023DD354C|nr:DNA-binding protein [Halorhabdus sp. BNX81]WEL22846.1 DNA-binding protein [Halorhabdus sp. BNX81]